MLKTSRKGSGGKRRDPEAGTVRFAQFDVRELLEHFNADSSSAMG